MSLANKYRPQTFDEMIGQEHIIDILKAQMLSRETVHHNYLLFGPRGTGKTTTARLIAKGLNCENLQNGNPCNVCASCQLINSGGTLDYVEIDAASHTGVDNIREEIIDKALYPPTSLRKKIYVIDEVHMLSKGAFNALLKTIEEPKNNVCFILATTELHKVPDTIISRCQVFNYRKVATKAMIAHLEHICQKEGLISDQGALEIIANISEGHVRDAVKYIDQVSILGSISEENIAKFLGVAGASTIQDFFRLLKHKERASFFQLLDQIDQKGIDLIQFAKQVIGYADQHLLEDTTFYLQISQKLGELLSVVRRYPHASMAYKIVFNEFLSDSSSAFEDNLNEKSQTSVPFASSRTDDPAHSRVVISSSPEQQEVKKSELSVQESQQLDLTQLWREVIAQLSPTVQSNLKDGAVIESITGESVELIVITSIAKMLVNNEQHQKTLLFALEQKLGRKVHFLLKFMSKEEYLAMKLG